MAKHPPVSEFDAAAGRRLTAARRALNLTQAELADALAISPGAIGNYEQGKRTPDPAVMARFCLLYGVTMDFLYRGVLAGLPGTLLDAMRRDAVGAEVMSVEFITTPEGATQPAGFRERQRKLRAPTPKGQLHEPQVGFVGPTRTRGV
jgi:transcriptional regulator with XRE-family HTH domain